MGGYDPLSLVTTYYISNGIVRGRTYRLRYRTLNGVGYSGYSPLLYATAANVPNAPPSPYLISATGTSIQLGFYETAENGGSQVLSYELWRDNGALGTAFTKVTTYTDNAMTHTLTTAANAITGGLIYTFKYKAVNVIGASAFSPEVRFAIASPPAKPATPTRASFL